MVSKLVKVINPLASSEELVGAELTNQLVDLLHGVGIDVDEDDLSINTVIRWWKDKFTLWDANQTHLYKFSTEDISDEEHKTILWRDITTDIVDSPVYENEPQVLKNKILGVEGVAGTQLGENIDALGKTINNLGKLMIHDSGDRNIPVLDTSNTTPNTYWDFLKDYNTAVFGALSSATDVKLRIGYNSEIDYYEFWSKASGSNVKLLSIDNSLIEFNVPTIDFKDAIINNFQQGGIELLDVSSEPVANTTVNHIYREDIDANNHAGYISKLENGSAIKVRVY